MAEKQKPASRGREKFYVTTAIDYVNGAPHIGHAIEKIQADVLARWHRLLGDDVFFLTGTDENTLKVIKAAEAEGLDPEALADKYAAEFERLAKELNLSNDAFIRTSDKTRHHPGAIMVWNALDKAGYLYKDTYEGQYCVECEQFYTEKEIVVGKCPVHGIPLEQWSEENYMFKLSAFTDQLRELIESDRYLVRPETRRNEILAFIRTGLQDVSFSRPAEKLTMGVPVPGDDTQRMYVWCDALTNYITGVGYGWDQQTYDRWWPADLHIVGKDILRFHAAIWPAMLLGAGLPLPKELYVHGFFTLEGAKISKSQGNVIDPFQEIESYGVDPLRYYLIAILPYAEDGNFAGQHFSEVYNAELANDLGNLTSRVLAMIEQDYGGAVPDGSADPELKEQTGQTHHRVRELLDQRRLAEALERLHELVSAANRFVDTKQPYKQDGQDRSDTLYTLAQVLGHLGLLYEPFIPGAAAKLRERLGLSGAWNADSLLEWEKIKPNTKVTKGDSLFPKK